MVEQCRCPCPASADSDSDSAGFSPCFLTSGKRSGAATSPTEYMTGTLWLYHRSYRSPWSSAPKVSRQPDRASTDRWWANGCSLVQVVFENSGACKGKKRLSAKRLSPVSSAQKNTVGIAVTGVFPVNAWRSLNTGCLGER